MTKECIVNALRPVYYYNSIKKKAGEKEMGEIKSAREIAMEKDQQAGDPTEQELLEWKYLLRRKTGRPVT
jgi:hypothetical protein